MRFIIEYDFTVLTIQLNKRPPEHRVLVFDKFETALSEYRSISHMRNFLEESPVSNLKVYLVQLDNELNLEQYL